AWQREHRPPPPPATASKAAAPDLPAAPTPGAGKAPAPAATPGGPPAATGDVQPSPATTLTIKTDLYAAEIDSNGGVIAQVALSEHRNGGQTPYSALLRTGDRTFVAQSGLLGQGLPNHRTQYEVLPGPRELAPGADHLDLKLQATAPNGI